MRNLGVPSIWCPVVVFTVAAMVMAMTGCGPPTPRPGVLATGATSLDGGEQAPRAPMAAESDAGMERMGAPTPGPGGTPSCTPVSLDGGPTDRIADATEAGTAEAGREIPGPLPAADGGVADTVAPGTGGRGGAPSGGDRGDGAGSVATGTGGAVGTTGGIPGTTGGATGATGGAPGATGGASGATGGTGGILHGTGGAVGTTGGIPGATGGAAGTTGNAGGTGGTGASALGGGGAGGSIGIAPAPGPGDLAMVELLINPASTDTGREWVEVLNRSGRTLSLAGLHVADAANDAEVDFGGGGGLLAAAGSAVLIQSGDPTKNGGVILGESTPGGSFGTLVSLNNDADTISICFGACATGVVIDRVAWDASLGAGYDGHALVIDDSARRCPAIMPFGDAGSFGTPGAANSPCP